MYIPLFFVFFGIFERKDVRANKAVHYNKKSVMKTGLNNWVEVRKIIKAKSRHHVLD